MISVQDRVPEDIRTLKQSLPEIWISSRFNDLHNLLSGEPNIACAASIFLSNRPPEPRFIERLRNLSIPWDELFAPTFPWDLAYALFALRDCVHSYKKDVAEDQWVVSFAEKHHERFVNLIEWLARPPIPEKWEYFGPMYLSFSILDGYLHKGLSPLVILTCRY
jgi:hypothetical protein